MGTKMKGVGFWVAFALLLATLGGVGYLGYYAGWAIDLCQVGEQIPRRERALIFERSRAFIQSIRDGDTTTALERMSASGRNASERIALVQLAEVSHQNREAALTIQRMFKLTSLGSPRGLAPCTESSGVARLARGGGMQTTFVVLSEPFLEAEREWTVWFEREGGEWRVRGVHLGLSRLAGRSGAEFWQMATEQRRKNNTFNSTVLYDLANVVFYRGAFLQLAEADGFSAERGLYRRHEDLVRARLQLGAEAFPISQINAMMTSRDGFVLVIDQILPEPLTVDEAIIRNRALIDGMNEYRPEWSEVFDSLAAGSPTGPNRLWRTVYMRGHGYQEETERL